MNKTFTLNGSLMTRIFSFFSGIGMIVFSFLTIRHFFMANYPETIFEGSFCDISAFLNCDSSAFSSISQISGVPLGYFGLIMGSLFALGMLFPSPRFDRTNTFLSLLNLLGVIGLFMYSVFILNSLCLLCLGYYLFSIIIFFFFWTYGIDRKMPNIMVRFARPSIKLLTIFAVVVLAGAYGFRLFHEAKKEAQTGNAMQIVKQYYELPKVESPSIVSPYWTAKSTEKFEDAAIQIIEYADFLCPDCLYLTQQLDRLKKEFDGKINISFQFFPLDARCNSVVDKNKHPGACDLSYMAAYKPEKFLQIHDEIFANFESARSPEWRRGLARKYGVEEAINDPKIKEIIQQIINTGMEYEKTSDRYTHGIRSTPTMIMNNRMIIGTLPYEYLKAIFQALVEEHEGGSKKFIENWVPLRK
ncbi:MAG: thioredoxin domain-containing protein [Candidatus Aminicenantes bacterium]|nr:thioredoxin domain-containing protein [Candidatus Aminicenantes bacterium]